MTAVQDGAITMTAKSMGDKSLANVISTLSAPAVLLGLAVAVFVTSQDILGGVGAIVFFVVGGSGAVIPWLYYYLFSRNDEIDPPRKRRGMIYLGAMVSMSVCTVIFGSGILTNTMWYEASAVATVYFGLFYVVNYIFEKASLHTGTFVFVTLFLADQVHLRYLLLLLVLPLVVWARIELRKHNWLQIFFGLAIGGTVGLITWLM